MAGGQLLIWDKNCFEASDFINFNYDRVIGVRGVWKDSGCIVNIINVHGPHDDAKKVLFWDALSSKLQDNDESCILCGDFNDVRVESDRFNCEFIEYRARRFNDFIADNRLIDIPLGGRNFTRVSDDGIKFSKLDRFLVNENFHNLWSDLTAVVLDRHLSDHCPILLKDEDRNFGPKPFKLFDAWLDEDVKQPNPKNGMLQDGINQIISEAWNKCEQNTGRKDRLFRDKLKNVKNALRSWSHKFNNLDGEIDELKLAANNLEIKAETCVTSCFPRI
ncbi:uncharacterized protein [Rutidosis leptorrhynchoides]|uniref:uncharacterized protein n=1 Tax=Rutidosis leptorrhynchoides TaxID=125765 RepID=UPI003A98E954